MAIYDRHFDGYRIFIGDLGRNATRYDVERAFEPYGDLIDVWVARNPPGFAFLVFKNADDCERAVRRCHGRKICGRRIRVEFARPFDDRDGGSNTIAKEPNRKHRSHRHRSSRYRSRSRSRTRSRSHRRSSSRRRRRRRSRRVKTRSRTHSRSSISSRSSSRHSRIDEKSSEPTTSNTAEDVEETTSAAGTAMEPFTNCSKATCDIVNEQEVMQSEKTKDDMKKEDS